MDKKLASTIGAAARAARMRLELTQADVAERIEVATEWLRSEGLISLGGS